jgi:hypothetical protein
MTPKKHEPGNLEGSVLVEPQRFAVSDSYEREDVRYSDLLRIRAEMRNKCRGIFERMDIMGMHLQCYISPVKPGDIRDEDIERLQIRQRKALRGVTAPEYEHVYRAHGEKDCQKFGEEYLKKEEKAKYIAEKMHNQWRRNYIVEALTEYKLQAESHGEDPEYLILLEREVSYMIAVTFVQLIKSGKYEDAIEGLLRFAQIKLVKLEDLRDYGFSARDLEGLSEVFEERLVNAMNDHFYIYEMLLDIAKKLGLACVEKVKGNEKFRVVVKLKLLKALRAHPIVFKILWETFQKAGLTDEDYIKEENVQDLLKNKLVAAMQTSPEVYIYVRDVLAEEGLIEPRKLDNDPVIQGLLHKYLVDWYELKPDLYDHYSRRFALAGLFLEDGEDLELKWQAYKRKKDVYGEYVVYPYGNERTLETVRDNYQQVTEQGIEAEEELQEEAVRFFRNRHQAVMESFLENYPYFERLMIED